MAHYAKKLGGELQFIELTAGTTVDVTKNYDKWNTLTEKNFIVEYSFTGTASMSGVMAYGCNGSATITPKLAYDKSTGKLTISGLSGSKTGIKHANEPNSGSMSAKAAATVKKVTLVVA